MVEFGTKTEPYRTDNTEDEIKAKLTCSICLDFYRFESYDISFTAYHLLWTFSNTYSLDIH